MGSGDHGGRSRRGRVIALIIAATALAYIGVQIIGTTQGWSNRTMGLFDLIALGLFGWALLNVYFIWRDSQGDKDG